jgi:hypothetical protein
MLMATVAAAEGAARKGKMIDKIVSALTSSTSQNANFVKLKVRSSNINAIGALKDV